MAKSWRLKFSRKALELGIMALIIIFGALFAYNLWFNLPGEGPVSDVGKPLEVSVKKQVFVEVIYDLSGSMWGKVGEKRKYEIGQELIKDIILNLPDNVALGLRLIGSTRENDPWDTTLVVRPQFSSREGQLEILEEMRPKGMSPIGYALEQAGRDLKDVNGEKHIILVTDGRDNGVLQPVEIVQELKEAGIRVHVFDVESAWPASAFLRTLSEISGGKYYTSEEKELVVATFAIE